MILLKVFKSNSVKVIISLVSLLETFIYETKQNERNIRNEALIWLNEFSLYPKHR